MMNSSKRDFSRLCRLAPHPPHSTVKLSDAAGTIASTIECSKLVARPISMTHGSYVEREVASRGSLPSHDTAFHLRLPWRRCGYSILRAGLATFASGGRLTRFEVM